MWYQAFRGVRKQGKKKSKDAQDGFNSKEYEELLELYVTGRHREMPKKPMGAECYGQYRSALKALFDEQVARKCNAHVWEHVWNANLQVMMKMVRERKAQVSKSNYDEKVDKDVSPYTIIDDLVRIEACIWGKACGSSYRSCFTWMRNRFTFLMSYCGILRCESIFNAELSDLLSVCIGKDHDAHPLEILVMQIPRGKSLRCDVYLFMYETHLILFLFFRLKAKPIVL